MIPEPKSAPESADVGGRTSEQGGAAPAAEGPHAALAVSGAAESRECYRVTTLFADVAASLGEERDCTVLDVSGTGFALVSVGSYGLGDTVPVTLTWERQTASGEAIVRSVKELRDGKIRYGFRCGEGGDQLSQLLGKVNITVQRQQLRRRSRRGT